VITSYADGPFVPVPLLESLLLRLHEKAEKVTTEAAADQAIQQRTTVGQVTAGGPTSAIAGFRPKQAALQ
jgi:hypothetical protein